MKTIEIPDFGRCRIAHLVLDFNGTIALDGILIRGVEKRLTAFSADLDIHILTADTFGNVSQELAKLPVQVHVLAPGNQDLAKQNYVEKLGPEAVVCIGNGRNDSGMLKKARVGIAVLQEEGMAVDALLAADIICPDILSALDLLDNPLRLTATLRR